jgi:hypothetical protein
MKKLAPHLSLVLLVAAGCSAKRPALYPNDHYQQVGQAAAERDIDECRAHAEAYVKSGGVDGGQRAGEAARNTGVGAAVGAAGGAAGGAVAGSAGWGAAIGAASGAAASLFGTMFGWMFESRSPEPVYANFVERCLRDRGYDPIGWQ